MRRISSKASWIFSVFLLLAGAGAAQAYNLTPFQDICMEAYVTLDGDLDDITYDADERMVEIAADNRIRIGRNDCYRNTPAFEDGTVYLQYDFEAFTLDSGEVVYTSRLRGMVSSALLVDVNQFERDPDYLGFQSDQLTVYDLPGYYGVNNRFDWRVNALENVQELMRTFADDWGDSRRY